MDIEKVIKLARKIGVKSSKMDITKIVTHPFCNCTSVNELYKLIDNFLIINNIFSFSIITINHHKGQVYKNLIVPEISNQLLENNQFVNLLLEFNGHSYSKEALPYLYFPQLSKQGSGFKGSLILIPIEDINDKLSLVMVSHKNENALERIGLNELKTLSYIIYSKFRQIELTDHHSRMLSAGQKLSDAIKGTTSPKHLGPNLREIMKCIETIFPGGCKGSTLWFYNESQIGMGSELVLWNATQFGIDELKPTYLNIKSSLIGLAVKERKIKYFENVQREKLYGALPLAEKFGLKKMIAIPIFNPDQKPIGVLSFYPNDDFEPDTMFINTLQLFIRSIERLLEVIEMKDKLNTLDNVISIHRQAKSITTEKEFFEKIVLFLKDEDLFGVEGASIFLKIPGEERLRLEATTGIQSPFGIGDVIYRYNEGLTGQVAASGKTIIVHDLTKSKEGQIGKAIEITESLGQSWIGTPIKDRKSGEVLGVIRCVNIKQSYRPFMQFTVLEQKVLEFIAFISGLMIQYSRMLRDKENTLQLQDEFIRSLTHEINIPIMGILGRLSLLKETFNNPSLGHTKTQLWFKDIESECFYIEMTARSYQVQRPIYNEVNIVKEIIQRVKFLLERLARSRNIDIYYMVPEGKIPNYKLDKNRMLHVMYNIVNNAIKYSYKNTTIEIEVIYNINNSLRIDISNYGIGIPIADEKRVFEQFFRTSQAKRSHPSGTGVGLYYCKKIIEGDHGGQIWVEKNNNPTIFSIIIPGSRVIWR